MQLEELILCQKASKTKANFRDLEVKSGSNKVTFLLDGDTGDLSMNGILKVDSITNSSGVAIENVLLKDGDISGNDASFNNVEGS